MTSCFVLYLIGHCGMVITLELHLHIETGCWNCVSNNNYCLYWSSELFHCWYLSDMYGFCKGIFHKVCCYFIFIVFYILISTSIYLKLVIIKIFPTLLQLCCSSVVCCLWEFVMELYLEVSFQETSTAYLFCSCIHCVFLQRKSLLECSVYTFENQW